MKISACVIVKNEAENLPRWLNSAQGFADEIIVVDTGSSDETVAIAAKAEAKIYSFPWMDDFSAAKNFALDQATGDWVVFTDADEYFTEESVSRVRPLVEKYHTAEQLDGFIVHLVNVDMDTGAVLGTQAQVPRIFRRAPWLRFVGSIHEHVENLSGEPMGQMMFAPGLTLYHTGYSPRIMQQKAERNLKLLLEKRAAGETHLLDSYYLMECYYSLRDYQKAAEYAREAMAYIDQIVGSEDRPHSVLLQSLILMKASDHEITEVYQSARSIFPTKAYFSLIYGIYAWESGYCHTAREAYREGICLHEEYYREGDLSANFISAAYTHLGEFSMMRGEMEAVFDFYMCALRNRPYMPALIGMYRLLARIGADDVILIEILNKLYGQDANGTFLMQGLAASPFPRACLYYEKRSKKKLSQRRRALLVGEVRSAGASLIEDIKRCVALARCGAFTQNVQGVLALLVPHTYQGDVNTPEARRMQRRAMRMAAYALNAEKSTGIRSGIL